MMSTLLLSITENKVREWRYKLKLINRDVMVHAYNESKRSQALHEHKSMDSVLNNEIIDDTEIKEEVENLKVKYRMK